MINKIKKPNKHISIKAYTMIEVSLLIIVLGILITGIYQGTNIYRETVTSRSQSLTQNSILGRTNNILLWYETTLSSSLISAQRKDSQPITQWFDNNQKSVDKNNASASQKIDDTRIDYEASAGFSSSGPLYIEKGINYLPTLRFKNTSNSSQFLAVNSIKLGSSSLAIFLVMQFKSYSSNAYIFDRICTKTNGSVTVIESEAINQCRPVFSVNISPQNLINFTLTNQSASLNSTTNNLSNIVAKNTPYLIQFERDFNQTLKFYLNGKLLSSGVDNLSQFDSLPLKIGRHASLSSVESEFDLSEIVIIEDKIDNERKKEIENYFSKKYSIKLNR
ncbi:MAG: hypothetical protein EBS92_02430 [Proteobacteria bacterium]|nr:hypothetical protein [Pseudomonadota bacterium]